MNENLGISLSQVPSSVYKPRDPLTWLSLLTVHSEPLITLKGSCPTPLIHAGLSVKGHTQRLQSWSLRNIWLVSCQSRVLVPKVKVVWVGANSQTDLKKDYTTVFALYGQENSLHIHPIKLLLKQLLERLEVRQKGLGRVC